MKIGVLKETTGGERRVAVVPETVKRLKAKGVDAIVESGAGDGACFSDDDYRTAGAAVESARDALIAAADAVVKIHKPDADLIARLKPGALFVSLLYPLVNADIVRALAGQQATAIALDMIPRTTLAQGMDVLSSQANLAGYWAAVAAAHRLPKLFPLMGTAAGTLLPARVLVMGVGVAGLQAIATAKRLGAIVEATDVRPETKEQVESVGGKFLEVTGVEVKQGQGGYAAEQSEEYKRKQAEMIAERIARADAVITTALIPGRKAPVLVKESQVRAMKPGSVIVDLAAEQGGNVEGCEAGREVVKNGVTIIGPVNTASALPIHASQTFSRNVENLLIHISDKGNLNLKMEDEIVRGCVITRDGAVVHPKVREAVNG